MEPAESDLRNLFLIFYEVFRFCEGFYSDSDISIVFKSAKLLEDTYLKLQSIGALNDFENKLNEFWSLKGLEVIPLKFFEKASHEVLSKLLTDSNFSNDTVKLAVSEFLTMTSEKDFLELVKNLHHTNNSIEILKKSCTNIADFNAVLNLNELSKHLATNNSFVEESSSLVTSVVLEDPNNFKAFLTLLCNSNVCLLCPNLQEIVKLLSKLLSNPDHIYLYPLVFELSDADFCQIVTSWELIVESFIKIIEYSIEKLKCNYTNSSYSWINTGEEKSLTFQDITILINKLKLTPKIHDQLRECLNQLSQNGHRIVIEDIQRVCRMK